MTTRSVASAAQTLLEDEDLDVSLDSHQISGEIAEEHAKHSPPIHFGVILADAQPLSPSEATWGLETTHLVVQSSEVTIRTIRNALAKHLQHAAWAGLQILEFHSAVC